MRLKNKAGTSTYMMAAMLMVGVSVFAIISFNIMKRRRFELVQVERKQAITSLKYRLESALRSSFFIEKSFIEANPSIKEYLKTFSKALSQGSEAPPFMDAGNIRVLDPTGKLWLGGGALHKRGDLSTCLEGASCPITSKFLTVLSPQGTSLLGSLRFSISTNNIDQSGPINSNKSDNQFTVTFPINVFGAEWDNTSVKCREGFKAIQLTAPPLELLCVDPRDPDSL